MIIAYTRVSTSEQAAEGLSLEAQANRLRAYCASRGQQCHLIEDAGVSARLPLSRRPGGAELLQMVSEGQASGVAALRLDRLFRDAADCLTVTRGWDDLGVDLHCLDLGIDTSTPAGRAFLTVAAAFAEMERSVIAERTREGLRAVKAQGARLGGVPYGWRRGPEWDDDGRLMWLEVPGEQAVIRRIQRARKKGQSYRQIAFALNLEGVPARKGGDWCASAVMRVEARASRPKRG